MPEGFLPVVKTCLDEDYFLDVRRATTHVMYQYIRIAGSILTGVNYRTLPECFTQNVTRISS